MKLNIVLMCTGLGLLATALCRMGMIKIDRKFMVDLLPLIVVTIALAGLAYRLGGQKLTSEGTIISAKMIAAYMPMLLVMFVMMGEAMAVISLYRPLLTTYLAGKQGAFGALFSAYLMPGGLTSMPIVRDLWEKGVNPIPLIIFTFSSSLVNWQGVMVRQPILGWKLTAINFCLGTIVAFASAGIGWVYMAVR